MKAIEGLRGLPKELRKEVIANIIYKPFSRSEELNKYLNMDLSHLIESNIGVYRVKPCSAVFALGFSWSSSLKGYDHWANKFRELEGYSW